jgi:hypothetical protein
VKATLQSRLERKDEPMRELQATTVAEATMRVALIAEAAVDWDRDTDGQIGPGHADACAQRRQMTIVYLQGQVDLHADNTLRGRAARSLLGILVGAS